MQSVRTVVCLTVVALWTTEDVAELVVAECGGGGDVAHNFDTRGLLWRGATLIHGLKHLTAPVALNGSKSSVQ
jgi:hypothetical protein